MTFRRELTFSMLRRLLLLAAFLLIAGCSGDHEGELVRHWISCERSKAGKWVSPDRRLFNRFDIVFKSRYRVSFAKQLVVTPTGPQFTNCTVYDVKNWRCNDLDGSPFKIVNGEKVFHCGRSWSACYLGVNLFERVLILFRGVDEVERICNRNSIFLESYRNSSLSLIPDRGPNRP